MAFNPLVFFTFLCIMRLSSNVDSISLASVLFSGENEFIDLSYPFNNQTVYWPGHKNFEFTKKTEDYKDQNWYAANEFAAAEHGGTHLDAPYHFFKSGRSVEEIPLEKLIVPLIIVDISSKVNDDPNYVLDRLDLEKFNYLFDNHKEQPCVIIFKFGWSKYYENIKKYLGIDDQQKTLNFPGLSAGVAEWITFNYKNVVGIGVDVGSVDPGSSKDFAVHKITAKFGLYNLENVNLNQHVPDLGCTALVMPMKIAQGTGAPLRLVAICPKKFSDRL